MQNASSWLLMLRLLAYSAALYLSAAPLTVRGQTILNGSFELPSLGNNGYATGAGDSWVPTGSNVFVTSNGSFSSGNTIYGLQLLHLASAGNSVAQTVGSGFAIGQTYYLSLAAADSSRSGESLMVSISGGATASTVFSIPENGNAGVTGSTIPFLTYGLPFTVTTGSPVTFNISAVTGTYQGFTTNGGEYIDNVVVSPAPEPGTWVSMVLGMAVLGWAVRRRSLA